MITEINDDYRADIELIILYYYWNFFMNFFVVYYWKRTGRFSVFFGIMKSYI